MHVLIRSYQAAAVEWAVERWHAEVANRPLVNVHRRTLDDTWRQVIRHFGGDPNLLCGLDHDGLLAAERDARMAKYTADRAAHDKVVSDMIAEMTKRQADKETE